MTKMTKSERAKEEKASNDFAEMEKIDHEGIPKKIISPAELYDWFALLTELKDRCLRRHDCHIIDLHRHMHIPESEFDLILGGYMVRVFVKWNNSRSLIPASKFWRESSEKTVLSLEECAQKAEKKKNDNKKN